MGSDIVFFICIAAVIVVYYAYLAWEDWLDYKLRMAAIDKICEPAPHTDAVQK